VSATTLHLSIESEKQPIASLPNLIYIGDVPIERSYHGSLVLYRLLEDYPAGSLTVIETGTKSISAQRLTGVSYLSLPMRSRWLDTRFHSLVLSWSMIRAARPDFLNKLSELNFDAVMTVGHGLGWLLAAAVADGTGVPLHLIMHDDWPRIANVPQQVRNWLDRSFGRVYRQASSRMCVSPFMREDYSARYRCDAEVLYPSRAKNSVDFETGPTRVRPDDAQLRIAFAGTINSEGYVRVLRQLSQSLSKISGRLLLFGPITQEAAKQYGLDDQHVVLGGLLSPSELIVRLRNDADALFVPMSFDRSERSNMKMAFPSKLADYTATGLPLLIYGPPYCSAVHWAQDNPGVAEVIAVEDPALLAAAIRRLANPTTRVVMGQRAIEVGRTFFSHDAAQRTFHTALRVADPCL
jgi:glycosyltransferase involved in cell wall biosynthesis